MASVYNGNGNSNGNSNGNVDDDSNGSDDGNNNTLEGLKHLSTCTESAIVFVRVPLELEAIKNKNKVGLENACTHPSL